MSLLRIFAVMLVVVCFTFVGCKEDTGQPAGDTTGVEKGEPTKTDDSNDDGSGAPKDQPDDAETDDDAPADDAGDDTEAADDAAPAEEPAPAAEKKDGE